jgi:hypothetical protein
MSLFGRKPSPPDPPSGPAASSPQAVIRSEVELAQRSCQRFIGSNGSNDAAVDLVSSLSGIPLNRREIALVRLLLPASRIGTTGSRVQRCDDVLRQLEQEAA